MNAKTLSFYIIDDHPFFIEMMTEVLEDEGHSVSSNHSAILSLSEIRKQKPDCILVDLQMAEMNGLELCQEIRKMPRGSASKIIFVSAHADESWKQKASEAGGDGYITKPIDVASFLSVIAEIVEDGA